MNKLILYSSLFGTYTHVAIRNIYTNYTVCLDESNISAGIGKQVFFTKLQIEGKRGSTINGKHLLSSAYILSQHFILSLGSYVDRPKCSAN